MEKIKTYRQLTPAKRHGYVGHIIPIGKGLTGAIIMVSGETEAQTHRLLDTAITEAPDKYKNKYDL